MKTIDQRVQAGIKFLDEKYGDKWIEKIDLGKLDLASNNCCILGQLDVNYTSHRKKLELDEDQCRAFGFNIICGRPENGGDGGFDNLSDVWQIELRKLGVK